jgi:hypothetical protein
MTTNNMFVYKHTRTYVDALPIPRPAYSLELNPMDFCVWGHLKQLVKGVNIFGAIQKLINGVLS